MARCSDKALEEIIGNEGYRDAVTPVNPIGVLRLCLDLQEARAEISRLQLLLRSATGMFTAAAKEVDRLATPSTNHKSVRKRTKKK